MLWKNDGISTSQPKNDPMYSAWALQPALKLRRRKRSRSRSGRGWWAERQRNVGNNTAKPRKQAMTCGLPQPHEPPSTTPSTSNPTATAASGTAIGSKRSRGLSPFDSRRSIAPATSEAVTNGTLMKNTQRQPAYSTSMAPSVGPMAAPSPAIPPHTPMAMDRRLTGNSSSSRASEAG